MFISFVLVSLLVAAIIATAGTLKVIGHRSMIVNARHLRYSRTAFTRIGALELVGSVGLVLGLWWKPLSIVTGIAVCALMIGAVIAHIRVKDAANELLPAITAAVSAGYVAVAGLSLQ
ncbi:MULTISPECIES: DoxX family protein [Actinomycetes]|uniref:DoxX family protein n=1 Tax=Actinomycetes TaxID=1760 RepID=UPI00068D6BA9|nr:MULTISPECIES: DoxX family protein [Actinomycetes]